MLAVTVPRALDVALKARQGHGTVVAGTRTGNMHLLRMWKWMAQGTAASMSATKNALDKEIGGVIVA